MSVDVVFQFFFEHLWAPLLAAVGVLIKMLLNKNEEFGVFKQDMETRVTLLESQIVTSEHMRGIIQDILIPHLDAVKKMDSKLDSMANQITDIRVHIGK